MQMNLTLTKEMLEKLEKERVKQNLLSRQELIRQIIGQTLSH